MVSVAFNLSTDIYYQPGLPFNRMLQTLTSYSGLFHALTCSSTTWINGNIHFQSHQPRTNNGILIMKKVIVSTKATPQHKGCFCIMAWNVLRRCLIIGYVTLKFHRGENNSLELGCMLLRSIVITATELINLLNYYGISLDPRPSFRFY